MTAPSLCFACQQPVLIVTTDTGTRMLDPQPDPDGTVEIRRSGLGWRGRWTGANTTCTPGWLKFATHSCPQEIA
jgi:hypothetical protein